ncbi:type II toxin-antitoxin system Phd/YefM family antitoxin [Nocardioides humi]|uniref:Antitoxin n=1 Tax=Nocardioides humi TaxID=449461 RepID=A0ABN2AL37_9ACTN|nr:type II toxin-antitoxin system prevent-host-death family antitoxin [Nocardioides humi]
MERIPHRELRNNSAEILRRVAAGESFEITNHGEVVAVLNPAARQKFRLKVAKPATRPPRFSLDELKPAPGGRPMQEILDELREDRL